jgi:hypothetical protein
MLTPTHEFAFYSWLILWGGFVGHVFTRVWQLWKSNKQDRELAEVRRPPDYSSPLPRDISGAWLYLRQAFEEGRREGQERERLDRMERRLLDILTASSSSRTRFSVKSRGREGRLLDGYGCSHLEHRGDYLLVELLLA